MEGCEGLGVGNTGCDCEEEEEEGVEEVGHDYRFFFSKGN